MKTNIPEARAELEAAFAEYERALLANDVATLNRLFLDETTTIRYGVRGENQYGYTEIVHFRTNSVPASSERRLARTLITTYGRDFGVAATLYYRKSAPGKIGRQMQTWMRTSDGWRVIAAHVSMVDGPDRSMP